MKTLASQALFDRLSEGVLILHPSGRPVYANPVLRQWLELTPDAALPDDLGASFAPPDAWAALLAGEAETELAFDGLRLTALASQEAEQIVVVFRPLTDRQRLWEMLAQIARELNATVTVQRVLEIVLRDALRATELGCGDIVLIDPEKGEYTQQISLGCPMEPEGDIEADLELIRGQKSQLVLQPAGFHPEVQAVFAVPFSFEATIAGVIHLHGLESIAFDRPTLEFLDQLASQTAVAVGNAARYQEQLERNNRLRRRTEQIAQMIKFSRGIRSDQPMVAMLEDLVYAVQEGIGFNVVVLSLVDGQGDERFLQRVASAGLPLQVWDEFRQVKQPYENIENLLCDEFKLGNAFFIPADKQDTYEGRLHTYTPPLKPGEVLTVSQWHVEDLFVVPLRASSGEVLGILSLDEPRNGLRPTAGAVALVEVFANQAAVALENVQLNSASRTALQALEARADRLTIINRLSSQFGSTLNSQEIMDTVVREMAHITNVDQCRLILFDPDLGYGTIQAENVPVDDAEARIVPMDGNPSYDMLLQTRQPLAIEDVSTHPATAVLSHRYERDNVKSMLIVPMLVQDRLIGSVGLNVVGKTRTFTEAEKEMCAIICSQAAIALDNARLYEEVQSFTIELEERVEERTRDLERERDRISALLRINSELSTSLDLDRVLHRSLEMVGEIIGASQGSIYLMDRLTGQMFHRVSIGLDTRLPPEGKPVPFAKGEGLLGWMFQQGESLIIDDARVDERWSELPDTAKDPRSVLAVPLSAGADVVGVLVLFNDEVAAFSAPQLQLVETAGFQVATAINNAELFKLIGEQAQRLGGLIREEQEEAAKQAAILESVADGVMVVDANGEVILFNARAEFILDLERSEILAKPISEFIGLWGKAGATWSAAIQEWTHARSADQVGQFLEERLVLGEKVVSVHLAPVLSGRQDFPDFLGTVSVFRDITRDVELDRMQREWVSTVSHELRTPMTSIKGYADLLMLGAAGPVSDNQSRFLEVIKNNADRLSLLVNDLLDISRIETGRMKLDLRPIHLTDLVGTVVDNLHGRSEQEDKQVEVFVKLPKNVPSILGDIDRVTQVLTNLVDNAFNYTPEGGSITVSAERGQPDPAGEGREFVKLAVIDTGIGITPEDQAKIFDRFFRSDNPDVQKVSGTGLGLAIVTHLVHMHGGRLDVFSEGLGKGSTFSFTIPVAPEA